MNKDSGVTLTALKVDGGMVQNDLLMQFQADLLDVDVIRPAVAETTALGAAYAAAQRTMAAAHIEVARWLAHGDVMLLPTTPQTAFAFGEPVPANQADYTGVANMAGVPALSAPLPCATAGLPGS